MELTIAIIISILGAVISVSNFVLSRKDKALRDAKEDNFGLLNYKIDELKQEFSKFSDKFDRYENEIDSRIEKAVNLHIQMYHSKDGK